MHHFLCELLGCPTWAMDQAAADMGRVERLVATEREERQRWADFDGLADLPLAPHSGSSSERPS